jgi:hypothetical protein
MITPRNPPLYRRGAADYASLIRATGLKLVALPITGDIDAALVFQKSDCCCNISNTFIRSISSISSTS